MKKLLLVLAAVAFIFPVNAKAKAMDAEAAKFVDQVVGKIEPVLKDDALAYWNATTTGDPKWYKKYEEKEIEYRKILSDKTAFEKMKAFRKGDVLNPVTKRQVELLYLEAIKNQVDPKLNEEMVKRGSELEKKFNTYRAKISGVETPDNKIREILKSSKDVAERQAAWEASKQIGAEMAKDLVELVELRNRAAKELGFKDYYELLLAADEQDVDAVFSVLNELAKLTDKPFKALKSEIDAFIAKKFGILQSDVKPWHYEDVFFQEPPNIFNSDLGKYFKNKDVVALAGSTYDKMGLDTADILKRSDLFERKGKEQHAYCIDIDRKGDVRILANVKPSDYWAATMLHELGHGVYSKYHSPQLPYVLRDAAHIFTTEGVAQMMEGLMFEPKWLETEALPDKKAEISAAEADLARLRRADLLVFARWVLVMANFERELYKDPRQDLNKLWWTLVEKYQLVKKPEGRNNPDWAAKIHFTSAPAYYHNYQLGRLYGAQLEHAIGKDFYGKKETGEFLKAKVFGPGALMKWDEFVKKTTGEKLTAKYFAEKIK